MIILKNIIKRKQKLFTKKRVFLSISYIILGGTIVFLSFKNYEITNDNNQLLEHNKVLIVSNEFKQNIINEMEVEIKKLKENIVELEDEINEKDSTIQTLQDDNNDKINQINNLQEELETEKKNNEVRASRGNSVDTTSSDTSENVSVYTSEDTSKIHMGKFKITFYTQFDAGCNNITAMGTQLKPNYTVAVDPEIIPLGSKLYIEGFGYVMAEDIGGAIRGNIIDYCVSSTSEAFSNGVQYADVWIVK